MSSPASEQASGLDPMDNALDLQQAASKKKRNFPGTPDPLAEVIALSPRTLMATNRFVCEVCGKGFQRDQNLQLHRRGHNLPWKLKQRDNQEVRKRVYVCPEVSCVHHDPSRALGDLTGIKKHFFRKHGDKKWECEKCSKKYAVQSDWKAHQKVCGTREYRCDCGTVFSRRDSFITHRAFCDALTEETAKISACNPIETGCESIELDEDGAAMRVLSNFEALTSPLTEQFTGGRGLDMDLPVREVPGLMASSEMVGVDSAARQNRGPALSLSLGTGPGPGPPDALQMLRRLPHPDSIVVASNEGGASGEETTQWHGVLASMEDLPKGSSETWWRPGFSTFNSDSEPWQVSASKASIPMAMDSSLRNFSMSHFAPPPSSADVASCFGNGYYSPLTRSSSPYQMPTLGSAQLPATALLQKAAMMGATSSIPSMFHSYGGDSRALAMKVEAGQQDYNLGVTASLSSSYNSLLSTSERRQSTSFGSSTNSGEGFGGAQERAEGSPYPALYNSEQGGSMQEMLSSLCSRGAASFQGKVDNTGPPLRRNGGGSVEGDDVRQYAVGLSDTFCGRSTYEDGSSLAGLSGVDQGHGNRKTLDFLGVEHPGGGMGQMAGAMAARALFQREIANITTVNSGMKREPASGVIPAARGVKGETSSLSQGR